MRGSRTYTPYPGVVMWYDPHTRSWVVQRVDAEGNQIGEADYSGTRAGAEKLAKWKHDEKKNPRVRVGRGKHATIAKRGAFTAEQLRQISRRRVKSGLGPLPGLRKNPAVHWYIHIQKHGAGPVMLWNGLSFTSPENRRPQPFASATNAMQKARWLLGKYHRHLRAYKIWVSDVAYGAPTQATRVNPKRRKNPAPAVRRTLDEAARKLEDFTGREATHVEKGKARSQDKTGLVIGELDQIGYQAAREGIDKGRTARYVHKFAKGSRPLLAVSTDGKQLHVVGGQYEFTEAGIEDR